MPTLPLANKVTLNLLVSVLAMTAAPLLNAQHFSVLKDFPAGGADGGNPVGNAVVRGNKLYGVTKTGGTSGKGVLYSIGLDGSGFEKLRDFSVTEGAPNSSGGIPRAPSIAANSNKLFVALNGTGDASTVATYAFGFANRSWEIAFADFILDDKTTFAGGTHYPGFVDGDFLYGANDFMGSKNMGVLYRWSLSSRGKASIIKDLGGPEGERPEQIIDGGSAIYGTTTAGGSLGKGVLFRVDKNGSNYRVLRNFEGVSWSNIGEYVPIVLLGDKIYGIFPYGGTATKAVRDPEGYLFSLSADGDGSDFKVIRTFDGSRHGQFSEPVCLATDGTLLYVGMNDAGSYDKFDGALISIKPDGTGLKTLYAFPEKGATDTDTVGIVAHQGRVYGLNQSGGSAGLGTIWSYEPSQVPVKFLPRKRSVAAGKTAKIMAMVSNDTLQPRSVTLTFSSSSPDVTVSPKSIEIPVPGKKSTKSKASFARVPLTVTAGGAVKGEVKVYATDGSFSASPCTLTVK